MSTPSPADAGSGPYYPGLDGVGGLAILLVLIHNPDANLLTPWIGDWLFGAAMHAGWIGVGLFFVLSGFLITDQLLRSQSASNYYTAFYGRRVLRIFPLYYTVLSVFFVLLPWIGAQPARVTETAHHQVWLWTFLSNWANPFGASVHGFGHFWSLAVEEQFYLLWPLVVHRLSARRLLRVALAIALAALMSRAAMRAGGADSAMIYEFTVCRMDALALGAGLAAAFRNPAWTEYVCRRWARLLVAATALLTLVALVTRGLAADHVVTQTVGHTVLSFTFVALVAAAIVAPRTAMLQRALALAPLRSLGKYSYGIYVLHLPIHTFWLGPTLAPRLAALDDPGMAALYVACVSVTSYAAAWISYHALEAPCLRLKRRFVPRVDPAEPGRAPV